MLTWQKVLIVDDSKATSRLVARIVEQCGFQFAVEANNAKEALACMRRERFGLVLCDVEMPDMNGVEMLCRVRSDRNISETPFVLMTTQKDVTNVIAAKEYRVDGYLLKPFTAEMLTKKLQAIPRLNPQG